MNRPSEYLRMTQEAMDIALSVGYEKDTALGDDYFEQRRRPHSMPAMPDVIVAWPDEWCEHSHPLACKCELCGREDVYDFNNCGIGIGLTTRSSLVSMLFKGHTPPVDAHMTLCLDCYKRSIPHQVKLREVVELRYYVNSLERAIRERRSKDNRSNPNHACQRGEGSAERRP